MIMIKKNTTVYAVLTAILIVAAMVMPSRALAEFTSMSSATEGGTSAAWADYDADGDLDLAAAYASGPARLVVYKNTSGMFSEAWSAMEPDVAAVRWGDSDGDGDLDLFVAAAGQNRVYANGGADQFSLAWTAGESEESAAFVPADYDSDGDLDAAAANPGMSTRVYRNDGAAEFSSVWTSSETDQTRGLDWGDLDGDGDPDILTANDSASLGNRVYRNDDGGSFTLIWTSVEKESSYSAQWVDYDADGDLDQVIGNNSRVNRVYRNNGLNSFTSAWSSEESDGTMSFRAADYDADGDLDLLAGNYDEPSRVYRNDGGASFVAAWSAADDSTYTNYAVWGDADGDGDLDFYASNYNTGDFIYRNDLNPGNTAPPAPVPVAEPDFFSGLVKLEWTPPADDTTPAALLSYAVRVGSCAGCSDIVSGAFAPPLGNAGRMNSLDIRLSATGTYYWAVAAIDASGFATSAWSVEDSFELQDAGELPFKKIWTADAEVSTVAAAWADIDGDGDLDLAVGHGDAPDSVYRNDSGDSFSVLWTSPDSDYTNSVEWGDYDGDGDLDLLAAGSGIGTKVIENSGGGLFSTSWQAPVAGTSNSAVWCDYDGDGDLDFAEANGDAPNRVFKNVPGGFELAWTATVTYSSNSFDWADYNADGRPDLVVSNGGSTNKVYRNDGDDTFGLAWYATDVESSAAAVWGDYDGDGDPDFFVANMFHNNRVYRNDGSDSFAPVWSTISPVFSLDAAWGDYDGDGDLDVVTANLGNNKVFRNAGSGLFYVFWGTPDGDGSFSADWGDYDADGDLDFFFGNTDVENRLYENLLDPVNFAPGTPAINALDNVPLVGSTANVTFSWSAPSDDLTDSELLTYQLRVGSCAGCNDVVSGAFAPPSGNTGATTSVVVEFTTAGTYYWSVAAVDTTGYSVSGWSAEDEFVISVPETSFTLSWTAPDEISTSDAAAGDIDGDGDLDIVVSRVSSSAPSAAYAFNGSDYDTLWTAPDMDSTAALALGDYDSDGALDIIEANVTGTPNRIYKNDGAGAFSSAHTSAESDSTQAAAWFDCDNDGDLDYAAGNGAGLPLRVYRGGAFDAAWSSSETNNTRAVAVADYDADGFADLLAGNANFESNIVYRNTGGCSFVSAWSDTDNENTYAAAWGDYDGDGDPDFAVGNSTSADRVYRNTGAGFESAWTSEESYTSTGAAWGDYDSDGDLDLLFSRTAAKDALYRNDGGGSFTPDWSTPDAVTSQCALFYDHDGDGDLDFYTCVDSAGDRVYSNDSDPVNYPPGSPVASQTGDLWQDSAGGRVALSWLAAYDDNTPAALLSYQLRIGTSSGASDVMSSVFAPPYTNAGATTSFVFLPPENAVSYYWSVAAMDASGFATGDWSNEESFRLFNNYEQPFTKVWLSGGTRVTDVAWGDYDGDGDLDFAASASGGDYFSVFRNDGNVSFTAVWQSASSNAISALAWGDYDGDGSLDLAAVSDGAADYVYRNSGGGLFTTGRLCDECLNTDDAAWFDMDGDGDLDLAVAGGGPGLYRNDGTGFTTTGAAGARFVAAADYDGDGDKDIATYDGGLAVRENDGGSFSTAWNYGNTYTTSAAAWGDYDADGDPDLLIGNDDPSGAAPQVQVLSNDGAGAFTAAWDSGTANVSRGAAWLDYDGDGDLDAVVAGLKYESTETAASEDMVFRNDSDVFSLVWSLEGYESESVAAGDYDGDGDLDLLIGTGGGAAVYHNTLDPANNAPTAPGARAVEDAPILGGVAAITLNWDSAYDDLTPGALLAYQVRVGTCPGCDDVVSGGFAPPYTNAGATRTFSFVASQIGTYYWSVYAIDTTGFAASHSSNEDSFDVVAPEGIFELAWSGPTAHDSRSAAWGDYDGDGDLDALIGVSSGEKSYVLKNDGTGSFGSTVYLSGNYDDNVAVWIDMPADGRLDVLTAQDAGLRSDTTFGGDSFFPGWVSMSSGGADDLALLDYDRDGDLDFAAASGDGVTVFRNDGNGFTSAWSYAESTGCEAVAAADLNSDGLPDFAAGGGAVLDIFTGGGGEAFSRGSVELSNAMVTSLAWGDYDGDGDPDLLAGRADSASGTVNRLYANTAASLSAAWVTSEEDVTAAVRWGDYNADGWIDFAAAGNGPNRVYANDGMGGFSLSWYSSESENSTDAAWGDYDDDGDIDLIFSGGNSVNRIYRNDTVSGLSPPSDSAVTTIDDIITADSTVGVRFAWSAAYDETTPAGMLTYQLRVGSCTGCNDVVSGAYIPPSGNAGATTSMTLELPSPGAYYWSVAAIDSDGMTPGNWSGEDFFTISAASGSTWFTLSEGWNLVSFPASQTAGTLDSFMASYLPAPQDYAFENGGYVEGDSVTITAGHGYWVYATGSVTVSTPGATTDPGASVTVSNLSEGWNLIGNPFDTFLQWNDNIIFNCGGGDKTISQAIAGSVTDGRAYSYSGSNYISISAGGNLVPWNGYFVYLKQENCSITLKSE